MRHGEVPEVPVLAETEAASQDTAGLQLYCRMLSPVWCEALASGEKMFEVQRYKQKRGGNIVKSAKCWRLGAVWSCSFRTRGRSRSSGWASCQENEGKRNRSACWSACLNTCVNRLNCGSVGALDVETAQCEPLCLLVYRLRISNTNSVVAMEDDHV